MSNMKNKNVFKLSRSIFLLVFLLSIFTSLIYTSYEYKKGERILEAIVENSKDIGKIDSREIKLVKKENANTKGYIYREISREGIPFLVMLKVPSKIRILLFVLIPTLVGYLVLMWIIYKKSKEIEERSIESLSKMIKYLEALMRGKTDEDMDDEFLEDFRSKVSSLGGDADSLIKSFETLTENQKIRRDFSANVTHELKSPLTSINGYAEMIATGIASEEDSRRFATIIQKEGDRLLQMINETIQLSKFDTGNMDYSNLEDFDLMPLIEEIVISLGAYARSKDVKVIIRGLNTSLYGNKILIEDTIRNIISNAIKYSRPRGGKLYIIVAENDKEVILSFEDNGIGIEQKDQERIFERFYVVDKSRGNKTGTGLGLSLVKHIVSMHNGKIEVQSKLNEGSIFTLRFPKNLKDQLEEERDQDTSEELDRLKAKKINNLVKKR